MVGEDDTEFDDTDEEDDADGYYYLVIPDQAAIAQLLRLWSLWRDGEALEHRHRHWGKVFECLHDLRRWGAKDRVSDVDAKFIAEEAAIVPDGMVRLELELIFTTNVDKARAHRDSARVAILATGGAVTDETRIAEIAYDALLVDVPANAAASLAERAPGSLAHLVDALTIRPQSIVDVIGEREDAEPLDVPDSRADDPPIAAILDAVPIQNHPAYVNHLEFDDPDSLERLAVGSRAHGTAMASLLVRGDLMRDEAPLTRRIYFHPLLHAQNREPDPPYEIFPRRRLLVDQFVRAILRMKQGTGDAPPSAPGVILVNLSLGDDKRPFAGRMSPWARAIDWLAYEHGILFFVSTGNAGDLEIADVRDDRDYKALDSNARAGATLAAVRNDMKERRILSPAEAINAVTVGALHDDACGSPPTMGESLDPLPVEGVPSQVSRTGLGFRNSLKPDIVMPGGRLRVYPRLVANPLTLRTSDPSRYGGLRVAGWKLDVAGAPTMDGWSGASSGATALATRAAHRIYDALVANYPDDFLAIERRAQALVVKALLIHRSKVPSDARALVEEVFAGGRQRNNHVRRLYGFGVPSVDESVACLTSRATLWGVGSIGAGDALNFRFPLPAALSGRAGLRHLTVTLAWFTPIIPGRNAYRSVRLTVDEPIDASDIVKKPVPGQASRSMVERGTLFHRQWKGSAARRFEAESTLVIPVVRKLDPNTANDLPELIPFGITASFETADLAIPVYEEVKARLAIQAGIRVPLPV